MSEVDHVLSHLPIYCNTKAFSASCLQKLRSATPEVFCARGGVVCTSGSYARREACDSSDLDYFVIGGDGPGTEFDESDISMLRKVVTDVVPTSPAQGGAFGVVQRLSEMMVDFGGEQDTNSKITRRLLFLLEGDWISNEIEFRRVRDRILRRYLRTNMAPEKIARFLLNDIIRYYRTISVDFEHKTFEQGKPWGIRYVKLVFSRKMIYLSGIFSVAETMDLPIEKKIDLLHDCFDLSPVERIGKICGVSALPTLKLYDQFLGLMCDPGVRRILEQTNETNRDDVEVFGELRSLSHKFNELAMNLLKKKYRERHPIFHSLLF